MLACGLLKASEADTRFHTPLFVTPHAVYNCRIQHRNALRRRSDMRDRYLAGAGDVVVFLTCILGGGTLYVILSQYSTVAAVVVPPLALAPIGFRLNYPQYECSGRFGFRLFLFVYTSMVSHYGILATVIWWRQLNAGPVALSADHPIASGVVACSCMLAAHCCFFGKARPVKRAGAGAGS